VTITNSEFSDLGGNAFDTHPNNLSDNDLTVKNSLFNNIDGSVFNNRFRNLLVSGNTFNGAVGGSLFDFRNMPTFQAGSTGNVNNSTANPVCNGNFKGTIELNGIAYTSAPCS